MAPNVPPIIYGTAWKKDATARLVEQALSLGFRGIDTACQPKHYNEPGVGEGVAAATARGMERSALYLQTKFTPLDGQDPQRIPYAATAPLEEQVQQSCEVSLRNLKTSYLDALLLHSPLRSLELTLRAWRALERCVEAGSTRTIGLSNCYDPTTFQDLWDAAKIKPAVLQNRFYADTGYDRALRAFCLEHSVRYQSFWTLTANPHVLRHPTLHRIAKRHDATLAQTFLRCLTQRHIVPLVGTTSEAHMRQDLSLFDFELSPEEVSDVLCLLGPA